MQVSVYYHSPENGEYLCQVAMAGAGISQVKQFEELSALDEMNGNDVVLVEYQDNNPHLDNWIARNAGQLGCPEIFLFVDEASSLLIWKAVKLGARELFCRSIPAEDFQEALRRVEVRRDRLGQRDLEASICPLAPGSGILCPSTTCRDEAAALLGWRPDWAASGGN